MANQLDRALTLVLDRFSDASTARAPYETDWLRAYQMYRSFKEDLPEEDEDLSNLFIPKTFADIESITPRIVMASISTKPWVTIMPREKDDVKRADMFSRLVQAQYDRQDMFLKMVDFYKQALIYGTSPGIIGWRERKRVARQRTYRDRIIAGVNATQRFGMPQISSIEKRQIVDWDDPWFEPLDIWDFFPDPDGRKIRDMVYIIWREWSSVADMERAGVYDNIGAVKDSLNAAQPNRPHDDRLTSIGKGSILSTNRRTKPVELLHMWQDDRVITVANKTVVCRDLSGDNYPYFHGRKPFVAIVDTPVPNEFWGIGTALATADLQEELNTRRNQRLDAATMNVYRMFVASRNAGINVKDLTWRPGGVVWVDDMTDVNKVIRPIDMPPVDRSAYEEESAIHRDMEQTNAVSDFLRGTLADSTKTATEIQAATLGANARVDMKVRMMAELGIKGITWHFIELDKQFITQERVVRLIGEEGADWSKVIAPGDLQFPFDDLIPAAANVEAWANRVQTRDDILRLLQIAGRTPVLAAKLDLDKLISKLMNTFSFADAESFIKQGVDPQMLMQLLAQNQGGGAASGGVPGVIPGGAPAAGVPPITAPVAAPTGGG